MAKQKTESNMKKRKAGKQTNSTSFIPFENAFDVKYTDDDGNVCFLAVFVYAVLQYHHPSPSISVPFTCV